MHPKSKHKAQNPKGRTSENNGKKHREHSLAQRHTGYKLIKTKGKTQALILKEGQTNKIQVRES